MRRTLNLNPPHGIFPESTAVPELEQNSNASPKKTRHRLLYAKHVIIKGYNTFMDHLGGDTEELQIVFSNCWAVLISYVTNGQLYRMYCTVKVNITNKYNLGLLCIK